MNEVKEIAAFTLRGKTLRYEITVGGDTYNVYPDLISRSHDVPAEIARRNPSVRFKTEVVDGTVV